MFAITPLRASLGLASILAVILAAAPAQAQTRPLCMSNDELRAYLHEALLFQIGYGGAVCCARDSGRPGSCRVVTRQAKRIEEVAAGYFQRNRETALRPFERSFPSRAEPTFRQYSATLEERAKKFVDGFGEKECTAWLNAIEALSLLREDSLGEFLTSQLAAPADFAQERAQIAACE
jgi:hypothetical protein